MRQRFAQDLSAHSHLVQLRSPQNVTSAVGGSDLQILNPDGHAIDKIVHSHQFAHRNPTCIESQPWYQHSDPVHEDLQSLSCYRLVAQRHRLLAFRVCRPGRHDLESTPRIPFLFLHLSIALSRVEKSTRHGEFFPDPSILPLKAAERSQSTLCLAPNLTWAPSTSNVAVFWARHLRHMSFCH